MCRLAVGVKKKYSKGISLLWLYCHAEEHCVAPLSLWCSEKKGRCRNSLYSKLLVLEKLLTGWKLCPIWGFWRGWYINIFVVWEPSCASIQNSFGLHHIYSLPQRTRNSVIRSHQNLLIIILRKVYSELFLCQVQTDQTDSVYVTGNSIAPTDVVTANLIRAHLQA